MHDSTAQYIDEISENERAIVVVHLYMHVVNFHQSVFELKMKLIVATIENLLKRNPNVKVFVKGPHSYQYGPAGWDRMNDFYGLLYTNILYKLFSRLQDKVIFLNNRDSSEALQCLRNHPPKMVVRGMMEQLLSCANY